MNGVSLPLGGHYYSTKEISEIFGVVESIIKRWTDSGKLKCFKTLGGHRRYPADWILELAERINCKVGSIPTTPRTEKPGGQHD